MSKLRHFSANDYLILTYHRVIPKSEARNSIQAGMYVEPGTFEMHLQFLKRCFKIVHFNELSLGTWKNAKCENSKPLCILTFDDGWYDFYAHTFPILKAYGIPATVFLPTDYIGTQTWFWTDRLAHLLIQRKNDKNLAFPNQPSPKNLVNKLEELEGPYEFGLEKAISLGKPYREDEIEAVLSEVSQRWNVNQLPPGRAFLSWDEIREMQQSGLVSFGSHTATHRILTTLTEKEIQDELMGSKERLLKEKAVDPSFIPFCYPNGDYNKRIFEMVKQAGYTLAVTTRKGWNDITADAFTLRRTGIHQDMTSTEAMLGCRIADIF